MARITSTLTTPDGRPLTGLVKFLPSPNNARAIGLKVVTAPTVAISVEDGLLDCELEAGTYKVKADATAPFAISVPEGAGSYALANLITSGAQPQVVVNFGLPVGGLRGWTPVKSSIANGAAVWEPPMGVPAATDSWQAMLPNSWQTIPGITEDQITHPHVLFAPGGWNGFEWWLVATPYVDSNDQTENPSIWCSNDGINWVVPAGVTNPLVPSPGAPDYNSDVHSWWEPDGRMGLSFREHLDGEAEPSRMKAMYSEDGVNWTTPETFIQNGVNTIDASPCVEYLDGEYHYFAVEYTTSTGACVLVHRVGPSLAELGDKVTCTLPTTRLGTECVIWHVDIVRVRGMWVGLAAVGNAPAQLNNDLILIYSVDGNTWTGPGTSVIGGSGNDWHRSVYKSCIVWNCSPPRLYVVGVESGAATKHRMGMTPLQNPLVIPTPTEAEVIAGVAKKGKWLFADLVDRAASGASPGAPTSHPGTDYTVDLGQMGILDSVAALGGYRIGRTGASSARLLFDLGRGPIFAGVTQDGGLSSWSMIMSYLDANNLYWISVATDGQINFQISRSGVITTVKAGKVKRILPERLAVRYRGTYWFEIYYNDRRISTVQPLAPRPVGNKFGLYTNAADIRWTNLWAQWERP